ncbi:hypothetical protein Hanom_Chr07g00640331 [Helianthus anomalus]
MPRFVFIGFDGYPSLICVSSGVRLTPSFEGLFADPSLHLASSRPPELLPMSTDMPPLHPVVRYDAIVSCEQWFSRRTWMVATLASPVSTLVVDCGDGDRLSMMSSKLLS